MGAEHNRHNRHDLIGIGLYLLLVAKLAPHFSRYAAP
jgi:hypothetical protein